MTATTNITTVGENGGHSHTDLFDIILTKIMSWQSRAPVSTPACLRLQLLQLISYLHTSKLAHSSNHVTIDIILLSKRMSSSVVKMIFSHNSRHNIVNILV